MRKVAIIVGHNKDEQGAWNYLHETEYEFNSYIGKRVNQYFKDEVQLFLKDGEWEQSLDHYHPDLVIELHFNSYQTKAYGCEALALKSDHKAIKTAENLLRSFESRFKIRSRGVKFVSHGDRGYRNLISYSYPAILFEPCFANFFTKDSKKIIEDPENYISFLKDFISTELGIRKKVNYNIMDKLIAIIKGEFYE